MQRLYLKHRDMQNINAVAYTLIIDHKSKRNNYYSKIIH